MLDLKQKGQTACEGSQTWLKQFQTSYPKLTLETYQQLDESIKFASHFGTICVVMAMSPEPMFALRLYGKPKILEYR